MTAGAPQPPSAALMWLRYFTTRENTDFDTFKFVSHAVSKAGIAPPPLESIIFCTLYELANIF